MNKISSFDSIANIYDKVRPGYPQQLYLDISQAKVFNKNMTILEIGSGTGKATIEILNYFNAKVIALEPSRECYEIIKNKTINYSDLKIENTTFEKYDNKNILFDGVFSATSFHWTDAYVKYINAYNLLKNDGLLVLYWNNYLVKNKKQKLLLIPRSITKCDKNLFRCFEA